MSSPLQNKKNLMIDLNQVDIIFDSRVTDRKPVNTGNKYQLYIGSASNIIVPLYLVAAYQKTQGDNPARPKSVQ